MKFNINEFEIMFESERIYFVKLSEKLVYEYMEMVNDIEVQKYITHDIKKYTIEQELEWIKSKLKEKDLIFSMIEKKNNNYIGNIEIRNIIGNTGEMGICITTKQQNKHFGQEAIKRIIDYSFNELNLDNLELTVYDFNHRGIYCYEKIGFKKIRYEESKQEIRMMINKEDLIK